MKKKKIFYNILVATVMINYLFAYFVPVAVLAQSEGWRLAPVGKEPFTDWCTFIQFIHGLLRWLLVFGLIIGVVMIIFGGISFLTAGGDTAKAGTAGKMIGFAAVGIVIIAMAFALVKVLASLVGIDVNTECAGQ